MPNIDSGTAKTTQAFRFLGLWDHQPLQLWVKLFAAPRWDIDTSRSDQYVVHAKTRALPMILDDDLRLTGVTRHPLYHELEAMLSPLISTVGDVLGADGYLVRLVMVRLPSGESIPAHRDVGDSFVYSHRVHVPVLTNDQVDFTVAGERRQLAEGEIWEINNLAEHQVTNAGATDRVHLILDWATPGLLRQHLRDTLAGQRRS